MAKLVPCDVPSGKKEPAYLKYMEYVNEFVASGETSVKFVPDRGDEKDANKIVSRLNYAIGKMGGVRSAGVRVRVFDGNVYLTRV